MINLIRVSATCWHRGLPTSPYLTIAAVRTFLTTFSPREIQNASPDTQTAYIKWILRQNNRLKPCSSPLPDSGGSIHWIGIDPDAISDDATLLLFFHGGGYAVPLSRGHLDWCWQHIEIGRKRGLHLGAAVLEYSLCPDASYPTQLQQAAEALKLVLNIGFRAENIVIGGDSAGGNLTFALLAHLVRPHPDVTPIRLNGSLGGAFGISPWLTMRMNTRSFGRNASIDMLSPSLIKQSGRDFLRSISTGGTNANEMCWCLPMDSPESHWNDLGKYVRQVYLNAGQHEMMRDHVLEFGDVLRQNAGSKVRITCDIGEDEAHDHILVDFMTQKRDGRTFGKLMDWMCAVFTTRSLL